MKILRTFVAVLFVGAMVALVLMSTLAFETPSNSLLTLSLALLLAQIVAVFAHLTATRVLTPHQKYVWFRQLTGARAPVAWAEYLTCEDPGAALIQISEKG